VELRSLRADLEAIFLEEVPASLRVAFLVMALLASHALGVLWMVSGRYERETVRAEVLAEVHEIRNQQRSLWQSHEAMRERRDRMELWRRR
jgi:hypothetical protein